MKRRKPMTDDEVKALYVIVLEIAAFQRGYRQKAQSLARYIKAEMLRRGI